MASMSAHFLDVGMGDGTLVQMRSGTDYTAPCEIALVDFGEQRTPSKIPYRDAMTFAVDFIDRNSKAPQPPCPLRRHPLPHPSGRRPLQQGLPSSPSRALPISRGSG